MLQGAHVIVPPTSPVSAGIMSSDGIDKARRLRRKRKAESQDNERLSKRLSLLNLEKGGSKLYVPVETSDPSSTNQTPSIPALADTATPNNSALDDQMRLDDSSHKVYIYNIDDELSSDSESEESGKLVFLSDIEKHMDLNRIPQSVLANSDGELAGMQVVLYSDPRSLSVPEEQDSVRKAIIESRRRAREQQQLETEGGIDMTATTIPAESMNVEGVSADDADAMDLD